MTESNQNTMKQTTMYRVVTRILVLCLSYSVLLICGFLLLKGTICATIALGVYVSVGLVSLFHSSSHLVRPVRGNPH